MNHLLANILQRVIKETKITLAGGRESVLAISERVNRKTQTLRLHWRAAVVRHQMEAEYVRVGHLLCNTLTGVSHGGARPETPPDNADTRLVESASSVMLLKKELHETEELIRSLEAEVLHEELIHIQRDLIGRSAGMARVIITPSSSAIGRLVEQLDLPPMTRVVGVLRGPVLLSQDEKTPVRSGDILILLGPQPEVQLVAAALSGHPKLDETRAADRPIAAHKKGGM